MAACNSGSLPKEQYLTVTEYDDALSTFWEMLAHWQQQSSCLCNVVYQRNDDSTQAGCLIAYMMAL